jgi:hypothetical protein
VRNTKQLLEKKEKFVKYQLVVVGKELVRKVNALTVRIKLSQVMIRRAVSDLQPVLKDNLSVLMEAVQNVQNSNGQLTIDWHVMRWSVLQNRYWRLKVNAGSVVSTHIPTPIRENVFKMTASTHKFWQIMGHARNVKTTITKLKPWKNVSKIAAPQSRSYCSMVLARIVLMMDWEIQMIRQNAKFKAADTAHYNIF